MRLSKCAHTLNFYLNHSNIHPNIAQDTDSYLDATELLAKPDTYFFIDNGISLLFWNVGGNIFESDIYVLPPKRGKSAKAAAEQALHYMFCDAEAENIIIRVPSFNKASQFFSYGLGFRRFKVAPDSWLKDGIKYDVIYYELERIRP